jgi:hypothetical protein
MRDRAVRGGSRVFLGYVIVSRLSRWIVARSLSPEVQPGTGDP